MFFKNWSLRTKIVLPTFVMVLIILAVSIVLMTQRAQKLALDQAMNLADSEALSYSRNIMTSLNKAMSVTRTLQSVFNEALKTNPIPRREYFAALLKDVLKEHPELSGAWIACLPGTFDAREEEYKSVWKGAMRVYHYRDGNNIGTSYGGVDNLDGEWFTTPMAGNAETITKPYPWTVDGKTNWLTSTGFPIQKNGKNIGVVGVDFYLTDLQKMVKKINPFGVGYGFLASNDGTIIAHPDDALLGKSLDEIVGRKQGQEYLQTLASRNPYSFEADFSKKGQEEYLTAKPIIIGNAPNAWSLAVVIPHKTVEAQANSVAETGILVGVGAVTVLLVLLFFLARLISLPVLKTAQFAKQVAAGNLDATLQINQKDETGVMVESLRTMIAKLKETISEAQGKAREAEEESDKACSAQLEAEKAKAQAVSARSSGLLHAAKEITLVLDHVVSATREMLRQSEGLLRNTEEQNDRINSTATAMEEMNATVLEIARNAGDASASGVEAQKTAEAGAQVVDQSKDAMNSTMAEVDDLNANMHMLDEQAKGIGSIINVINDIADQTNLLALNAAIEAARAGEAGRGFAVVADEVRKLAEKTMQATKEVSASISSIQQVADANIAAMKTVVKHIKNATELSNRSGEMLRDIVQGAEQSAEQIAGIATAAEEQSATSDEINNAVERISAITNQTADSARELSQALRSLEGQVAELNGIVEELKREGRA